ncbi:DUF2442 domain-containing protein [Spirosoma endophyticum]|uniref:DUF2442 domain-containing protein n=1 Tax=Spirosoma endophyticum TaxID=662367 RepID=A0A1I1SEY3_9BACT|nr:DUF2442 domain-containing protein [Spirosoma endophyticum]SFD45049.1 Protein of unknown function [Spirosoma endophyticum]
MSTLTKKPETVFATDVWFADSKLYVRLTEGREIGVPIDWYPRLRDASEEDLNNWRFIGLGQGIHWESLDEDLLVAGFLSA